MSRTSPESIRSLIETLPTIDLDFYIVQAGVVTDLVAAADATIAENRLTLIESLLAAHYYSLRDPMYVSRTTGQTSAMFQQRNFWKEAAMLDPTGTLTAMENGNLSLDIVWLGTPESEVVNWRDRN